MSRSTCGLRLAVLARMRWLLCCVLCIVACGEGASLPALAPDARVWPDRGRRILPEDLSVADRLMQPDQTQPDRLKSPCRSDERFFGGRCYWAGGVKWIDQATAAGLCAQRQAQIVAIHSAAENAFVVSLLPAFNQAAWIGLRRTTPTSKLFVWSDGTPLTYTNWAPQEPNNQGGAEQCAVIWGPHISKTGWAGTWNDDACNSGRDTVVCKR